MLAPMQVRPEYFAVRHSLQPLFAPEAQCLHQCRYDQNTLQYAIASSLCSLQKQNACTNADYKMVPIEKCLAYLKVSPEVQRPPHNSPLPVMVFLD
ncbi:uncharacterized protein LOC124352964 isoform X4 [Homalodisca vitripennis]|uniref:uncharacterized protein LOC124352964 isoform X4 n=1 Tax=Homalodisca vitripennis TaxID=197043 RepID=UPI001EEB26E9|nr:uncharacterized protein LOC124352964 isoform X4 [Homalodisca vitripennis]